MNGTRCVHVLAKDRLRFRPFGLVESAQIALVRLGGGGASFRRSGLERRPAAFLSATHDKLPLREIDVERLIEG